MALLKKAGQAHPGLLLFRHRLKVQVRGAGARHDSSMPCCAGWSGRSFAGSPPRRGARQIPRHRTTARIARRHQSARAIYSQSRRRRIRRTFEGELGRIPLQPRRREALAKGDRAVKGGGASAAVAKEDFAAAMARWPTKTAHGVDAFFDRVKVNATIRKCAKNR